MGLIAGVIAAGVLGAGATAYAGSQASDSASAANRQNQDIANATNALNYQMFLQSRGSQGSALLPLYFGSQSAEQNLANQAYATYLAEQQGLGTPADQLARYQSIVQGAQPAMSAGDTLVNQLFSGQLADQQVQNIAPVLAARGNVAASQKTGILEGLMQRLNALSADRARSGYVGGGSAFQKNLLTQATIPALQQAATVGAQADLANATDVANIKNQNINTRLGNLSLPLTQAANKIQLTTLPTTAAGSTFVQSLQPFDWFKLQPSAFQAQRPPLVTPVPNTGQVAGQAAGQFSSTLGNYFANRALINQLQNPNGTVPPAAYTTQQDIYAPIIT
jgi:hypothetical protein